jgi:hypothetical protein
MADALAVDERLFPADIAHRFPERAEKRERLDRNGCDAVTQARPDDVPSDRVLDDRTHEWFVGEALARVGVNEACEKVPSLERGDLVESLCGRFVKRPEDSTIRVVALGLVVLSKVSLAASSPRFSRSCTFRCISASSASEIESRKASNEDSGSWLSDSASGQSCRRRRLNVVKVSPQASHSWSIFVFVWTCEGETYLCSGPAHMEFVSYRSASARIVSRLRYRQDGNHS